MNGFFRLHPLLMGAAPAIFMYAHNLEEAQARDLWLPLGVCLAVGAALWGLLSLAMRSARAGALAASLLLLFCGCYGHLYKLIGGRALGQAIIGRNRFLIPLGLLLLAAAAAFVYRRRKEPWLDHANRLAATFAGLLLCFSLAHIAWFHIHSALTSSSHTLPAEGTRTSAIQEGPGRAAGYGAGEKGMPDIYYIIPDGYSSDSSLQEFLGYDNSPFTDYLKSVGFFIADKSLSNYAFTELSITSSLNMEYLNFLTEKMGARSTDQTYSDHLMMNNRVMAYLQDKGYTLVNAGSWWGPTSRNTHADVNIRSGYINEFTIKVMQGSILLPFLEEFTQNALRQNLLYAFDKLAEVPYIKAPTFTFAHVICPHTPFIFGPEGEKVPTFRRLKHKADPRPLYLDQVKFVNMKIAAAVSLILKRSPEPPVIIIQSDHGGAFVHRPVARSGVLPDDEYLREQMRIFNAYYLPGAGKDAVPDTISPVNTFRVVFNLYFGADMPLLGNSSYFSTLHLPFTFFDVTEKVKFGR